MYHRSRMTTTELPGRVDLSEHGIEPTGASIETRRRRCSTPTRSRAATGGSPRAGRSSSTPAASRAARPRTSSSSTSRLARPDLVGRRQPAARRGALRRAAREGRPRVSTAAEALYVVDAWAGADPAHRIGVRVITAHPYHALFAKTMFIELAADEAGEPSSRRRSCCTRPTSRPTRRRTGRGPARSSCCIRDGRSCSSAARSTPARSRSRSSP